MKVLDLDSSLSARKHLTQELHYIGDRGHQRFGSHEYLAAKQVMRKLAQNGGKVPDELKH